MPEFFLRDPLLAAESAACARNVIRLWARVGVPAGPAGVVAVCGEDAWVVGMGMIDGRCRRAVVGAVVPVCGVGGCSDGGVIVGVAVVGVWVGV